MRWPRESIRVLLDNEGMGMSKEVMHSHFLGNLAYKIRAAGVWPCRIIWMDKGALGIFWTSPFCNGFAVIIKMLERATGVSGSVSRIRDLYLTANRHCFQELEVTSIKRVLISRDHTCFSFFFPPITN